MTAKLLRDADAVIDEAQRLSGERGFSEGTGKALLAMLVAELRVMNQFTYQKESRRANKVLVKLAKERRAVEAAKQAAAPTMTHQPDKAGRHAQT